MVKEKTGEVDRLVGARIRAQRIALKKSLKQVAAEVGVTQTAIRLYETGKRQMTAQRIARICRALQIKASDLFASNESELSVPAEPAYGKHVLRIATTVSTLSVTKRRLIRGALISLTQILALIDEDDVSEEN